MRLSLRQPATAPETIARITCPIGQPGITGKDPAVIAVAVAAALLPPWVTAPPLTATAMTIYAATVVDTPGDPFAGDPAAALAEDGALLVRDGVIRARGSLAELRAAHPGEEVTRLDGGLLLPGFVDTHVHFPQIRAIGGLGLPLLDWLEQYALPEECKLADRAYARAVAGEFIDGLVASGTTSALVFGSHFAPAMDELFTAAGRRGLNITSGLVLSDRSLRPDLLNSPETALADSADLILRWHDRGRLRYAVTPRFSLSTSDEMLDACAQLLGKGVWFTSHINENLAEDRDRGRAVPRGAALPGHLLPARPGHLRAACSRTTSTPATPSSPCWPSTARRSRTARPATAPWAAVFSRCAGTCSTGSVSRSAPTWARAPGCSCPRRRCRPTSSSSCSARPGCA